MHDREPGKSQATGRVGSVQKVPVWVKREAKSKGGYIKAKSCPIVVPDNEGVAGSHTALPRERCGIEHAKLSQQVPKPGHSTIDHGEHKIVAMCSHKENTSKRNGTESMPNMIEDADGHDQKWCMRSGAGAPQVQGSALCRRAAVGRASRVRRQYTSLCWLVQGSRYTCGSNFLRKAAWSLSSCGAGRALAAKTWATNSAWRR